MSSSEPAILGGTAVFSSKVPLVRPSLPPYAAIATQVAEMMAGGMLTKSKYLAEFEQRLAGNMGVKHAVCVSSCTLGLALTYQGLSLTGEVIVPSFTFMATVHPLIWIGVTPVFVEIDADTWNIDPTAVEAAITRRTSAIVAVHNFGNPADIAALEAVAARHGLPVIFDAAHGAGARYRGRPVGSYGRAEVFSLSPTKLLVTGEGGIVATNDDALANHVRLGREYGNPGNYGSDFAGLNARMPEFNALLGIHGLALLDNNAEQRNRIVERLRRRLAPVGGLTFQKVHPADRCSYKDLSLRVDAERFGLSRNELAHALQAENIDTRQYHDPPVHTHQAYQELFDRYRGALPVTDLVAAQSISLPIWGQMDEATIDGIAEAITRVHVFAGPIRDALASGARQVVTVR